MKLKYRVIKREDRFIAQCRYWFTWWVYLERPYFPEVNTEPYFSHATMEGAVKAIDSYKNRAAVRTTRKAFYYTEDY